MNATSPSRLLLAVIATSLTFGAGLTGCASSTRTSTSTADHGTDPSAGQSSSNRASETTGSGELERITAAGVAALVTEHLGAENIEQFGTYGEEEEGTVGVVIRLRGDDPRTMFAVDANVPDADWAGSPEQIARMTCEKQRRRSTRWTEHSWCEDVEGGGIVSVQLLEYGFSDDNEEGRALMGSAIEADGRVATAMYETYTHKVSVDPQALLDLLADERLAWETDPAVNEAGRSIDVKALNG